jgi:surface antigen
MATTLWTTSSRRRPLLPVLGLCLATLACVGPSAPGPKAQWGAATGAAAGGLLGASAGHHPEAIVAGVLIGGLLGGALGNALDNADREYAARSAYTALEYQRSGARSEWYNPDTGHAGSLTPTQTYQVASGSYCREFTQTITVGGRTRHGYGTACRQPDGSWRIVD